MICMQENLSPRATAELKSHGQREPAMISTSLRMQLSGTNQDLVKKSFVLFGFWFM